MSRPGSWCRRRSRPGAGDGDSRPGGWWRRKSTPAKVETYTRWSFHFFAVIEIAAVGLAAFAQVGTRLATWLCLMVCVHALLCAVTASRALDWTRGRRQQPVRLMCVLGGVTAVIANVALALAERGPGGAGADTAAGSVFGGVLTFGAGTLALGVRNRRRVLAIVAGFAMGAGIFAFPLGVPGPAALGTAVAVLVGAGFLAFTSVFSVWLLNAVYELDAARETRARLAVAEERLRFGRDLHDVMGRNLAVIALKSELAVQLARRGRPEAVDQMTEVQRIARESQREVREVVRGYREADLGTELAGAQSVLTAAGIDCEVGGSATGLPAQVQSALGWVVREATTNALRHGDAGRCAVSLRVAEGRVTLSVENDGVPDAESGTAEPVKGSGLAGLRERLSEVDGVLRAGPAGGGLFRLTADVPLPPAPEPARRPEPGSLKSAVPHPVSEATP
ncbi:MULTISPECIES: sensor histidine kinase [unclassified Streptomyces]|uniref:sensor histidine kinase n=1 Tax=unclassified Streptomyces TaxID=2593676 RepID=UPI002E80E923|nr:sensor histidine kinase [Streptomyces sp. NBC_00589]WTI38055.1 sensor histidine kinase [Streptomyces sp. NBC_00775]WUB28266.1 sensor histidine kinase [Streptomyces sp. NBC_00589]